VNGVEYAAIMIGISALIASTSWSLRLLVETIVSIGRRPNDHRQKKIPRALVENPASGLEQKLDLLQGATFGRRMMPYGRQPFRKD